MATSQSPIKADDIKPKWVSLEDAEKLERFLNKQFVPKDNEEFAKKYFYRVESIIPYSPANSDGGPDQNMYQFLVQKYRRDKVETVTVASDSGGTQEVERNAKVDSHEMINGHWHCVDNAANMLIDSAKFRREFKADDAE